MKKILLLFILFTQINISFAQYGEEIDAKDALQASINVKSSAVKIVSDFIYKSIKVGYAVKEIDNSLSNSEDALLLLEVYAVEHPEIKSKLKPIIVLRKKGRMGFLHKPKKEKMKMVMKLLKKVIALNNDLITEIKSSTGQTIGQNQMDANDIEVLAYQLSFLHAIKSVGGPNQMIEGEINKCTKGINMKLDKLFSAKNNTDDITYYLELMKSDWEMAKKSINNNSGDQKFLNTTYVLMKKIGAMSKKIALLYKDIEK